LILRESGMPEQNKWDTFFTPTDIISKFNLHKTDKAIVDIGCGYGTFTIPLAKIISQNVYAVDINDVFLEKIKVESKRYSIKNIIPIKDDVFENKLNLPENVGSILLFNILHCENPLHILNNILPNLISDGKIFIIHWRSDIETPRGPSLDIRPKPKDIIELFNRIEFENVDFFNSISQYHYGLSFQRRK